VGTAIPGLVDVQFFAGSHEKSPDVGIGCQEWEWKNVMAGRSSQMAYKMKHFAIQPGTLFFFNLLKAP